MTSSRISWRPIVSVTFDHFWGSPLVVVTGTWEVVAPRHPHLIMYMPTGTDGNPSLHHELRWNVIPADASFASTITVFGEDAYRPVKMRQTSEKTATRD